MPFLILLLFSALSVSAVAGYFSIVGLTTIFPAVFAGIVAMGVVLEIAKLVTASWLYRNWSKAAFLLKTYFTAAVVVLSLITSMGIYGYLSKAHIEQTITQGGDNVLQIETLERQISNEQRRISDAEKVISQLDAAVQILQDYDRIRGPDGAIAVREGQAEERNSLNETIASATQRIETIQSELAPYRAEALQLEADIGPIKYIAALIYDNPEESIDSAVRIVILLLVLVFDPLAILLVIAANQSWMERKGQRISFTSLDETAVVENPMEPTIDVDGDGTPDITESEMAQFNRLDRKVRNKLEWLIDKGKNDEDK